MAKVLLLLLALLDPYLARINHGFYLLDVVEHKRAVDLLDQNGFHVYVFQFLLKHLRNLHYVGLLSEDAQTRVVVHLEHVVDQKFLVEVEIDVEVRAFSKIVQGFFMIANQFPQEILRHLKLLDFKRIERLGYFEGVMDLIGSIGDKLQQLRDESVLEFRAVDSHRDEVPPRLLPVNMQALDALNVIDMVLDNKVEDALVQVEGRRFEEDLAC